MSEKCEQTSERTNSALNASISGHFYPECSGGGQALAMAAAHSGLKLYEIDMFIS